MNRRWLKFGVLFFSAVFAISCKQNYSFEYNFTYTKSIYYAPIGIDITQVSTVTIGPNCSECSSYTISPSIPTGMSFNSTTGVITGTPTGSATKVLYTVHAKNQDGSAVSTFYIQTLNVQKVFPGMKHTCALADSQVFCWGKNDKGQVGLSTSTSRSLVVNAVDISSVSTISTGGNHTCALTTGGAVYCWGDNSLGQLGDGTSASSNAPVQVYGLSGGVTSISTKANHTCAVLSSGAVKCWGSNEFGQVGSASSTVSYNTPQTTSWTSGATAVAAGGSTYTLSVSQGITYTTNAGQSCALVSGGSVECLGNNREAQLGDTTTTSRYTSAATSPAISGASQITAGGLTTCALISGGVKCWGNNSIGSCGTGTGNTNEYSPTVVSGLGAGVSSVVAGAQHNCALLTTGTVKCWGDNASGQLGDGSTTNRSTPVLSTSVSNVVHLETGTFNTCVVTSSNQIQCWGYNSDGQLGNNTLSNSSTATTNIYWN